MPSKPPGKKSLCIESMKEKLRRTKDGLKSNLTAVAGLTELQKKKTLLRKTIENPNSPRNPKEGQVVKSYATNKSKDSMFPSREYSSYTNHSKSEAASKKDITKETSKNRLLKVKKAKLPSAKSIFKSSTLGKPGKKSIKAEDINKLLTGSIALKNVIKASNDVPLSTKYSSSSNFTKSRQPRKIEKKLIAPSTAPLTNKQSKQNSGTNSKSCSRGPARAEHKRHESKKKTKDLQLYSKGKTTNNSPNHFKMLFNKSAASRCAPPKDEHYESFHTSVEGSSKIRQQSNETALQLIRRLGLNRLR